LLRNLFNEKVLVKLKLTPHFAIAFLALTFVLHEAHEIVHTAAGRLICGCWGQRDFNSWGVCEGCAEQDPTAILATFAGPVFTFLMIWIGTRLIAGGKSEKQKAMGFSLIFANLPFARILTGSMGSGDEIWGLNYILNDHSLAWATELLLILLFTIIPLWRAYKIIDNNRKIIWFLGFLILPTILDILIVLGIMNSLLKNGILSDYWILGSPILVTVWTIFVTSIFLLAQGGIYKLTDK
jgi:hypothetical protein